MTVATYTRVEVAEKLGVSESRVRQLLAIVSERVEGATVENRITEAGFNAITAYRQLGRSAWLAANPIAQPQPITPVAQPEPQPITQPVYEMADRPGHELASKSYPAAVAFEVVEIAPDTQLAIVPTQVTGPSNLIPFAPVSQLAQTNIESTRNAIAAVRSMAQGVRSRLEVGSDVSWQQQQAINDEITALDLEIAELEVAGQLHRQQQIRTQAVQNLAGSEVGKRIARLQQLAAANGFQLQPQPC